MYISYIQNQVNETKILQSQEGFIPQPPGGGGGGGEKKKKTSNKNSPLTSG